MANSSYVNRYAKGLFNASVKNNSSGGVRDGLNFIIKILKSTPEFSHLLFTKNISRTDKKNILSNVLEDKVSSLVSELLIILIDNDQIQLLIDITNKYNLLMSINSTELDVSITSNIEFSSNRLESLRDNLSKKLDKQINIKNNIDKSIIGGVKLRIGNTVVDNSLSNKLMKLKNNLKNNQANME